MITAACPSPGWDSPHGLSSDGSLFASLQPALPATTELAHIAAGPVECLLGHHGAEFIDEVEKEAATDPQFARMPDVHRRMGKASIGAGPSLQPLAITPADK